MKRGLMKRKVYKLFFYVRSFDCFLGVISIFGNSEFFRFRCTIVLFLKYSIRKGEITSSEKT